ncbi:MAG: hypothetical protein AAF108_05945 [Planctomycetota bacterium]
MARPARWQVLMAAVGTATAVAAPAAAQPLGDADDSGLEARVFDFEEADTNPLPVPQGWYRAQDDPTLPRERPGFPLYNAAELEYGAPARSGQGSVRLPTRGGSTSLRLAPGVVPIFPSSDYRVRAHVRGDGLVHARFALRAVLLDQRSRPIEASRVVSELVTPAETWAPVGIDLLGEHPDAAYLQIDLELLQPREFERPFLGEHHVFEEDLSGAAFVDDVVVTRVPRVELATTSPANVVLVTEGVDMRLLVRDVDAANLSVELDVTDASGSVVAAIERPVFATNAPVRLRPRIDTTGWFHAEARVIDTRDRRVVGVVTTDFIVVPPPADHEPAGSCGTAPDDRRRFSLAIDDFRAGDSGPNSIPSVNLPELTKRSGVGGLTLGLWGSGTAPVAADLDRALGQVHLGWRDVGFAFDAPPPELTAGGPRVPSAIEILGAQRGAEPFERAIVGLLDRFGQSVRRWRLGAIEQTDPLFENDYGGLVSRAAARLGKLVPGPRLTAPWRTYFDADSLGEEVGLAGVDVVFASGTGHAPLARFAKEWAAGNASESSDAPEIRYVLPADGSGLLGPRASAAELVRRVAEFWLHHVPAEPRGGCPRAVLELASPLTSSDERRPQLLPTPELAAFRTAIDFFRGRRVLAELEPAPDVRCLVLTPAPHADDDRGGCLVVWSETRSPQTIRLFLGDGTVRLVDVFGNRFEELLPVPWDADDARAEGILVHDLPVTNEPVYVEGIDVRLTAFMASFALEPAFLETGYNAHDAEIVHDNPWDGTIAGTVSIVSPGGGVGADRDRTWSFNPRVSRFQLDANGTNRIPIEVEFSPVQEAGRVPLVLDIDLVAPGIQRRVRVVAPLEVGLRDITLDVKYVPLAGTADAVLEAIISNESDFTRSLELVANIPGYPRLRAAVDNLEPGVSISRRFTLTNARNKLRGDTAFIAAVDRLRGARLNRAVDLR